jgi:Uma2 family endonuclease
MPDSARKRATYEDLLAVPDDRVAEIIDGELVTSPRPALPHARAASVLGMDLGNPFERGRGGPGGWWILDEPELHLHDDVVVPDLAGWRRSTLPQPPDGAFCETPPDWVCEILSPSTARIDRVGKQHIYCREHVGHMWLVDPQAQTLEVFRWHEESWLHVGAYSGRDRVRAEPFDAVELELEALWLPQTLEPGPEPGPG